MPRKLVGDLKPGDMALTEGGPLKITAAYHNPLLESRSGKAWMIETEGGGMTMTNSLDEIDVAEKDEQARP